MKSENEGRAPRRRGNGQGTAIKRGNTWTAELPAGGASYTFAASYAGDGNHNGTTANCTVSVDKISPTLKLSPSSDTKLQ